VAEKPRPQGRGSSHIYHVHTIREHPDEEQRFHGAQPVSTRSALVLFAHGARDARWAEPFQRLYEVTQALAPDIRVALSFLALMSPSLPELAAQFACDGVTEVTVVPVFFGQGGHVMRDLPRIVQDLQQTYPHMRFRVVDAVGEDANVLDAIARYCLRSLE